MKRFYFTIVILLFVNNLSAQLTFSNIVIHLKTVRLKNSSSIIVSGPSFSFQFFCNQRNIQIQDNFARIDSQLIQITPLKIDGYKNGFAKIGPDAQRELLESYSNYELAYFKNDLNVEIIKPNSQWVTLKSRHWLVWYFRVGGIPVQANERVVIQLFASTIVGDKVLTINAPVLSDSDFTKAGLIVNEMMESFNNKTQNQTKGSLH